MTNTYNFGKSKLWEEIKESIRKDNEKDVWQMKGAWYPNYKGERDFRGRPIYIKDGNRIFKTPTKKIDQCFEIIELFFDKFSNQFIAIKETN